MAEFYFQATINNIRRSYLWLYFFQKKEEEATINNLSQQTSFEILVSISAQTPHPKVQIKEPSEIRTKKFQRLKNEQGLIYTAVANLQHQMSCSSGIESIVQN
jgi:hypothetical protein